METINKPEMTPLAKGAMFKTLQVKAKAGMIMPRHYATEEAVIVVQGGESLLKTPEGNHVLKQGDSFILPAKMAHSLEVKKDFEAIVTMAVDGEIEFPEQ